MNTHSTWSDAQIHAYVDGELDTADAARLEADSRSDGSLAARIARQRELRQLLQAGFDPVLAEPVPQRLHDVIAATPQAEVIALDTARRTRVPARRPAWSSREWGAIAATLLLGSLLGALAFHGPTDLPMETVQGRLVARGALDTALSTQPGGMAADDAAARVGLSFRAADGAWCRTFNLRGGTAGLACRRQGHWAVQVLDDSGSSTAAAPDGFRQAGAAWSPAMLGAIGALGAGEALNREQEQQQLRAGWETTTP